jgi:hypothetical protein
MKRKFKEGQKVEVNGNRDCTVLRYPYHNSDMVEIRFWDGNRLVGNAVADESEIKMIFYKCPRCGQDAGAFHKCPDGAK